MGAKLFLKKKMAKNVMYYHGLFVLEVGPNKMLWRNW